MSIAVGMIETRGFPAVVEAAEYPRALILRRRHHRLGTAQLVVRGIRVSPEPRARQLPRRRLAHPRPGVELPATVW